MTGEKPIALSPELARRVIDVVRRVEGMPNNPENQRARGPAGGGGTSVSIKNVMTTNTTVTNGTQPGIIVIYNSVGDTWSNSSNIRVKQINGYVLATGVRLKANYEGLGPAALNSVAIYSTSDQTGASGLQTRCNNTNTVTETLENGVVAVIV